MKIYIAIPCMEFVNTDFMQSILMLKTPRDTQLDIGFTKGSLVYDARNQLCERAIRAGCDRIMWIDSDMVFDPDLLERLSTRLDAGKEFVSGLCFRRKPPYSPAIFSDVGYKPVGDNQQESFVKTYENYPKNALFRIKAAGCAGTMMSVDLVKRIQQKFGLPFSPIIGFGEDISFCLRAAELKTELWCDSSIKLGHIAQTVITEETWEMQKASRRGRKK